MTFCTARSLGMSPIPLRPRSKVPLMPWKRYQQEPARMSQCEEWDRRFLDPELGNPYNIGFVTGLVSSLVVVDADTPKQVRWCRAHLPPTMEVITGRGVHFYYRYPLDAYPRNTKCENFDVRGEGGYVVAPGSIHENGTIYTLVTPWRETGQLPVFNEGWVYLY
jgi:hypothetical protein